MQVRVLFDRKSQIFAAMGGALALLASCSASSALAQAGISSWSKGPRSAVRLLSGPNDGSGRVPGGVEIRLDPRFKTYWRTPGDAGVPPAFDWSASENVASVEVRYPVPVRFDDGIGFSIGYDRDVVFPLVVTLREAGLPAKLDLVLNYAVCEKLCIPADAKVSLPLARRVDAVASAAIKAAEARVPRAAEMGQTVDGMAVTGIAAARTQSKSEMVVTIVADAGIEVVDVFGEAVGRWLFGKPIIEKHGGTDFVARIPIDDKPSELGTEPVPVTVTVVSRDAAIETKGVSLDVTPLTR